MDEPGPENPVDRADRPMRGAGGISGADRGSGGDFRGGGCRSFHIFCVGDWRCRGGDFRDRDPMRGTFKAGRPALCSPSDSGDRTSDLCHRADCGGGGSASVYADLSGTVPVSGGDLPEAISKKGRDVGDEKALEGLLGNVYCSGHPGNRIVHFRNAAGGNDGSRPGDIRYFGDEKFLGIKRLRCGRGNTGGES